MADPYVREVASLYDLDGPPVTVGVDYDAVTIRSGGWLTRLDRMQAEAFAQLFIAACWEAAANAERMRQEASDA